MKQLPKILTVSGILSLLFSSCASSNFKSQKVIIELEGNPTTGYSWVYEIEDEKIVRMDEEIIYLGKKGMVGAPSKFVYSVYSLSAGETTIHFEYKRPWEEKAAEEICNFKVSVKENGKLTVIAEGAAEENAASFKSVSMEEGLEMMKKSEAFILLDVRRPDEFSAGHIPGAILLTNETINEEKALELLPDKSQKIFVYCRSGRRSKMASQKLVELGYKNIIEIGGILDYSGEIEK